MRTNETPRVGGRNRTSATVQSIAHPDRGPRGKECFARVPAIGFHENRRRQSNPPRSMKGRLATERYSWKEGRYMFKHGLTR